MPSHGPKVELVNAVPVSKQPPVNEPLKKGNVGP